MATITLKPETQVSRKITKAKLNKGGGIDVGYVLSMTLVDDKNEEINLEKENTEQCRYLPHHDLIDGLKLLRAHLAIICDLPEAKELTLDELDDSEEALEKVHITGFSIGGESEHEGVTLIGYKILNSGKVLNLCAPFTKYQDEHEGYEYGIELQGTVNHCCNEVELYMDGKIAPSAQPEFPFPEGKDNDDDHPFD